MMTVRYDYLIAGGRVVDPDQGIDAIRDLAISGDRIAALAESIPAEQARQVYDARGRLVCPGLIDLHTHIGWGHAHSLDPDLLAYLGGATTNCDAGTVGRLWYQGWKRFVHDTSRSRALLFLCANDIGQLWHDHWRLEAIKPAVTGAFIREHRDVIIGVKLRLLNIEHERPSTIRTAALVKEMAAIAGVPTMFHMPEGTAIQPAIIDLMEPGDILTHCFASVFHLFRDNQVLGIESRAAAQARGIILDVGHGQAGFDFQIAAAYQAAGVLPDTISTDLHGNCIWRRAFDMPTVMSKFLYLGMSLPEVIRRATINPARAIRRDSEIGSLAVGKIADIAVLELLDGQFELTDGHDRNRVTARQRLRAVTTFCRGQPLPYIGEYARDRATWLPRAAPVPPSHASAGGSPAARLVERRPAADTGLLIRGGRLIDPAQGIDGQYDIAIQNGRITAIGHGLPSGDDTIVIEAAGQLVTPGLIDFNTHVNWGTLDCLAPDQLMLTGGTTTVVDAGTVGALDYRQFATFVAEPAQSRVLAFLNASAIGSLWEPEYDDLMLVWVPGESLQFMTRPYDLIIQEAHRLRGVTLRLFAPERSRTDPLEALARAKDIAELAAVPLMLQLAEQPISGRPYQSLAPYLRLLTAGDILSRPLSAAAGPLLFDAAGKLRPELDAARRRGIRLDLGHGRHWFDFATARRAIDQGLAPDIISSGLTGDCVNEVVFDLPTTMSKLLALGLPLPEVIAAATINPATALGLTDELGCLRPGAPADVTLLTLENGRFPLVDSSGTTLIADQRLVARQLLRAGQLLPIQPARPGAAHTQRAPTSSTAELGRR